MLTILKCLIVNRNCPIVHPRVSNWMFVKNSFSATSATAKLPIQIFLTELSSKFAYSIPPSAKSAWNNPVTLRFSYPPPPPPTVTRPFELPFPSRRVSRDTKMYLATISYVFGFGLTQSVQNNIGKTASEQKFGYLRNFRRHTHVQATPIISIEKLEPVPFLLLSHFNQFPCFIISKFFQYYMPHSFLATFIRALHECILALQGFSVLEQVGTQLRQKFRYGSNVVRPFSILLQSRKLKPARYMQLSNPPFHKFIHRQFFICLDQ